ncbi:flagellar basal body rod protein FlgB [Desulfoplanes formicivorans]|uniref:Uncharacterized protein n=1 Tax=Desulfoplanes formicivorans TaxID=1592317 RepID=A0A194AFI1_9BACT|nr:flagellar basal body protein [Desulfoplanes formicivorans]GAU07955.1 hypothetical protein DPF_0654 [Desulfoplanes formicivorans]
MSLEISASALHAFQTRQQVTSNNIANVNTPGFTHDRVDMQETSTRGVRATIRQDDNQPPLQPSSLPDKETAPSTTDLTREMVEMTATQTAYDANATTLSSQAFLQGKLINEMV